MRFRGGRAVSTDRRARGPERSPWYGDIDLPLGQERARPAHRLLEPCDTVADRPDAEAQLPNHLSRRQGRRLISPRRVRAEAPCDMRSEFRTMRERADQLQADLESLNEKSGALCKIRGDQRETKEGGLIRR